MLTPAASVSVLRRKMPSKAGVTIDVLPDPTLKSASWVAPEEAVTISRATSKNRYSFERVIVVPGLQVIE